MEQVGYISNLPGLNVGHGSHLGGSFFGGVVYAINRMWGKQLGHFAAELATHSARLWSASREKVAALVKLLRKRIVVAMVVILLMVVAGAGYDQSLKAIRQFFLNWYASNNLVAYKDAEEEDGLPSPS